jgi:hypothetical protein
MSRIRPLGRTSFPSNYHITTGMFLERVKYLSMNASMNNVRLIIRHHKENLIFYFDLCAEIRRLTEVTVRSLPDRNGNQKKKIN